ncbi:hypothetical protein LR48_Vigan03g070900 [Vigna angularis]|uniref:Uncharacterized protein n=1 Tax=Phaseolus angularis TaxID=3914 RepID=A0A0L9U3D1_PHAAN|nr:hypothetical protein LR48_Vigan03g070900 [Vigna angularis]
MKHKKSDSRLPLSEGGYPPPPPSPPSRHEKWKLARIRSSGSYTSDIAREMSERINSQGQFTQEGRQDILATTIERLEHSGRFEHYGMRPAPSPVAKHVVPPTGRSGKGRCSAAGALGDDMDDTRPLHGIELAEDEVKVTVDEVVVPDTFVLVPTEEFFTVHRHLSASPPDLDIWLQIGQEGSPTPKKTNLSEDDPLGALDELL